MMQMNIERMINATGSLLIWLVMILAAVILAGLIIIAAKAISQGIKDMDRKGERKDADNNTSEAGEDTTQEANSRQTDLA